MLIKLCVGNYNTLDGLVNGANKTFKDFAQAFQNHLYVEFIITSFKQKICQKH
jgi:hypothetical protein